MTLCHRVGVEWYGSNLAGAIDLIQCRAHARWQEADGSRLKETVAPNQQAHEDAAADE